MAPDLKLTQHFTLKEFLNVCRIDSDNFTDVYITFT